MRVSVNCSVTYSYEVDVPNIVTDLPCYIDSCDPVYFSISKVLVEQGLNYDSVINSIVEEDTDKVLYVGG